MSHASVLLRILAFETVLLAASLYAIVRGGAPERAVGVMLLLAGFATLAIPITQLNPYWTVEWNRLSIDVALFLGLTAVALRANRFWPLWVAALQLLTIGVHGVRMYDPAVLPVVYARLTSQLAYPVCIVTFIGALRYRRRRLRPAAAPERDWSPFRW